MLLDWEVRRLLEEWRKCFDAKQFERAAYISNDIFDAVVKLRRHTFNTLEKEQQA